MILQSSSQINIEQAKSQDDISAPC